MMINLESHLTIPRKGMETQNAKEHRAYIHQVALNYSPQGDGNLQECFA